MSVSSPTSEGGATIAPPTGQSRIVESARRPAWMVDIGVALLVLVAYSPIVVCGYIWDDDDYVTNNVHLRSADGLIQIWTRLGATPQYYPLVHSTFWIEYQLWGLHPLGYHAVNVALHALSACVLWRLLRQMGVPGAVPAAMIFAVHPVHVESVAWITERKNVLSAVLYLLSARYFLKGLRGLSAWFRQPEDATLGLLDVPPRPDAGDSGHGAGSYVVATVLFVAALLSKSVTASLPVALLIACWWRLGRCPRVAILATIPWLFLGLGAGSLTAYVERTFVQAQGAEFSWTLPQRVIIAGKAVWFYLGKVVWPSPLIFFYPRFDIDPGSLANWWPAAALVLTLLVLILGLRWWGRGPLAAALYFGVTIFPALGFVNVYPMRYSFVADHFQYLASLGPMVLIAAAIGAAWSRAGNASMELRRIAQAVTGSLVVAALATLVVLTRDRVPVYASAETLYRETLRQNPRAETASSNLGNIHYRRGELDEAKTLYEECVRHNPCPEGRFGLALIDLRRERLAAAREHLEACLQQLPRYAPAWRVLGDCERADQNASAAGEAYQQAVKFDSNDPLNWDAQIRFLLETQQWELAERQLTSALRRRPDSARVRHLEATMAELAGDRERALRTWELAITLDPNFAPPHFGLGRIAQDQGDFELARQHFERVLALEPDHAGARAALRALDAR